MAPLCRFKRYLQLGLALQAVVKEVQELPRTIKHLGVMFDGISAWTLNLNTDVSGASPVGFLG